MDLVQLVGEALATIAGGLLLATVFCWACWHVFKPIRHPEFAVPLMTFAVWLPFRATIGRSDVLEMALLFALVASPVLWCVGREWRRTHRDGLFVANVGSEHRRRNSWTYPVLVACIGEDRAPSARELRRIARRIKREAYPGARLTPSLRRRISHLALATLGRSTTD